MRFDRASGILLHPSSLSSPYGIGDLGPAAYRWVDWLAGTGCKLWQVLPLGPTGYGNSPYQSFSAFAGNPYLISPEFLLLDNLLFPEDFIEHPAFDPMKVDFGSLIPWKLDLLQKSYSHFSLSNGPIRGDYDNFCAEKASWLDEYALFMAIKEAQGGGAWDSWPEDIRLREPNALDGIRNNLESSIARYSYFQFIFYRQWKALCDYAHSKELRIIGDIPIFVANDSADVWSNPELFLLDKTRRPTAVAGVPPDYFSPTGQLWGNPLYRWEEHKRTGYHWWVERLRASFKLFDILRIDHFRGFAGYWEVPANQKTAEIGRWAKGPGADFFTFLQSSFVEELPIIAEDLGEITPDVTALRDQFSLTGMKVLQFAFSGPENPFLPHSYTQNCVVYTGTHDNDTTLGWFTNAKESERNFAQRYLGTDRASITWDMIRAAWQSGATFAIAPMQDFLNLGSEARFNFPSRPEGNWEWRITETALSEELQMRIKELNWLFQRPALTSG